MPIAIAASASVMMILRIVFFLLLLGSDLGSASGRDVNRSPRDGAESTELGGVRHVENRMGP